jgi:RNA polymerase sigma factor (sigma-70 family)
VLKGGIQESDLFQNAIIRLVENHCAAMRRFTGQSENELLAYLAVICRSVVLDALRHNQAAKRRGENDSAENVELAAPCRHSRADHNFERQVLIRELVSLTQSTIESHSEGAERDRLVFDLHFLQGLSFGQISQCKGVNLSKAGVEKLLKRMIARVQLLALPAKSSETQL